MSGGISRRAFLDGAVGASAAAAIPARAASAKPGFLWGAATAGHQVEGNNVSSDIWLLEQLKPSPFKEPSGDACDSLHRWREDVAIVRSLGLNCYRFSVEWARIEPEPGQFSQAFLDHYAAMVDHCRDQGLAPVVTLSHFTAPRWFAARGGWQNPDAPALFARFADRVARRMAGGISHAVTFNEPNLQKLGEWGKTPKNGATRAMFETMLTAAARACGSDRFAVLNAGDAEAVMQPILFGHAQAKAALKAVRGNLPVGLSLALPDDQAVGRESRIEEKRRAVYGPFLDAARTDDFIGIQTYNRALVDAKGPVAAPAGAEHTQTGDEYYPQAVGNAARYAHRATGRPVLVTENGIATEDDTQRIRFIEGALASIDAAKADGVPLVGYIHWSLLDNFEWLSGYGPKFGLVAVDRTTFKRTTKPSARAYARLVAARA